MAAEDRARIELGQAREGVRSARDDVMAAEAEPVLQEVEQASPKIREKIAMIQAWRIIMHGKWGTSHPWHKFANTTVGPEIDRRLREIGFRIPSEEELRPLSRAWAEYGERLMTDPDAQLL